MNVKWKKLGLMAGLSLSLVVAGCGGEEASSNAENNGEGAATNYSEEVDYTITGIEPGAGITEQTRNTLEEYENLAGWEFQESSTAGMLGSLDEAIRNEEPIIVTGWSPHYKFTKYDLKYLEDPKGTYGGTENINTIVRKGLEEDMPNAYTILDRFHWEPEDMEQVMFAAQDVSFEEAASKWIEENQDKVNEWTDGVEKANGESIEIVITPWDTERASGEVVKQVLEQHGFKVKVTPVDPAIMFEAIATGEGDASVAPWLPNTHKSFYEKHKDNVVDLGENLTGTRTGLVVPAYMDIDSIEDLQPKE
ncbi:glycine betaine ABC transporter substrate-binding protein [Niallia sp. Krafla_26]|uniref:glycine betaine ABC transporter substrate-binding protein n=1 Tax=Niallia sp. Krafla_26 TaxID=3064703 RepID=UPI003D169886